MNFLIIIFILIFSGCSVTMPHKAKYRITPKIDKLTYNAKECKDKSLKIMQSFTSNLLMSKEMKYAKKAYQESSFTESEWVESPSRAINSEILKAVRASNLFDSVSGYRSRSRSDLTLESNIEDFMQYFTKNNKKSFVNIVIYMNLIENKSSKVISSKRISKKMDVEKLNAEGGVEALNKALSYILVDTNKWLAGRCK